MDTTITSGQMTKLLELFKAKNMTPDRFQKVLGSGFLSDLLEADVESVDRDEHRATLKLDGFPIWRTLILKSRPRYISMIEKAGHKIGHRAKVTLGTLEYAEGDRPLELDLTIVSGRRIWEQPDPTCDLWNEYGRACFGPPVGLLASPGEVGPALRLAYADQPEGEKLYVAMKVQSKNHFLTGLFVLKNEGGEMILDAVNSTDCFSPSAKFVFVRKRI